MDSSANQPVPTYSYIDLLTYAVAKRHFYHGHEQDTKTIAANLLAAPLTLLYSASGVGKTSVLAAGVVSCLRAMPQVLIVLFRTWQDGTFLAVLETEIIRTASDFGFRIADFGTSPEIPEHLRNLPLEN